MNNSVNEIIYVQTDSDEDSYNNISQKLQKLKKKYLISDNSDDLRIDLTDAYNITNDSRVPKDYESTSLFLDEPVKVPRGARAKRKNSRSDDSDSDFELTPNRNRRVPRGKPKSKIKTRSKARGRAKTKSNSNIGSDSVNLSPIIPQATPSRGRRTKKRGKGRKSARISSRPIPIYNIGNTAEYPDALENQDLFSNHQHPVETTTVDLDSSYLNNSAVNEELSVKVYWQSLDVVKFNIRKLQKLTEIFDFFVNQEGVTKDNLLFTYNNQILTPDDTPESIHYNIAKFIEGGVTSNRVVLPSEKKGKESTSLGDFKVKFQCQSQKKPYEAAISNSDRLLLAMTRCAEHLGLPIAKLRFEFDGDIVKGHMTPSNLDMESGDCIDVKVLP